MKTGIIIPIYNLWKQLTVPCLQSIKKYTDSEDIKIVICDNASQDISADTVISYGLQLFGNNFHYHRNSENLGFAVACNQGAEIAKNLSCEFLLFLNNDTLVTENWFIPLFKALDNETLGLVGPLLLYPDNTVQHCGVVYTLNGYLKHIYQHFPISHPAIYKNKRYNAITGAALLTRTALFYEIGKFCEEFINGFEDIDLCYRYVRSGYACEVVHDSKIYHLESQSPNRLDYERIKHNRQVFVNRNPMHKPDAHIYYDQAGYLPSLTKDYYFYAALSLEKRTQMLKKITSKYSDENCYAMLREEPYWQDGYFLLADSLIRKKLFAEACDCCSAAFKFGFHFDELYEIYLTCAKKIIKTAEDYNILCAETDKKARERSQLSKANQQRLKMLVSEEWCKKMFLTRKNPVFLGNV